MYVRFTNLEDFQDVFLHVNLMENLFPLEENQLCLGEKGSLDPHYEVHRWCQSNFD